jgi:Xaa-Pro aminopeptidase
LEDLRIIKSPGEQQKLKRAGEIADRTWKRSFLLLSPKDGKADKKEASGDSRRHGSFGRFISADSSQRRECCYASLPGETAYIGEKDSLLVDFGCRFEDIVRI